MKHRAVAFFWTLPVPWAGFIRLPKEIDEAARVSRTIRFQRCLIRDYVQRHGLELVHEQAFLEINPDRGSQTIRDALNKAAVICRKNGATLIFVDFAAVQGWRSHEPMLDWLKDADVDSLPIEAVPVMMDGEMFDPHAHFGEWRDRQWEWSAGKQDRKDKALARAGALKLSGMKYPAIANTLNAEGVRSLSGRPWTPESLRKFMS